MQDALIRYAQAAREALGQHGFAHTGHVFQQDVATRSHVDQAIFHDMGLANDNALDVAQNEEVELQ